MKRVICVIVLICLSFTLFGCSKSTDNKPNSKKELAKEIVDCFNNDNSERLKNIFCDKITSTHNKLDEEILSAFNFIDGNITDYDVKLSSEGNEVNEGITTKNEFSLRIENVVTDKNEEYLIIFAYRSVDTENVDNIGMSNMIIYKCENGETDFDSKITIGRYVE